MLMAGFGGPALRASSANMAVNEKLWHHLGGLSVWEQKLYAFHFQALIIKYTIPSQGLNTSLFNLNQHTGANLTHHS